MIKRDSILVTGADGFLGGKLTKLLADTTEYGVLAVSNFPERLLYMLSRENVIRKERVKLLSSSEFLASDLTAFDVVGVVHLAFSRASYSNADIASSLDYSMAAFDKCVISGVQKAIYVSSQSVYGDTPEWRLTSTTPSPNSIYAMAKYAGEKLFERAYFGYEELNHTILRLDNVIQSQNLVQALCKGAKKDGRLCLSGGQQLFSYIDARDVPKALLAALNCKKNWKPVYNVGPNRMRVTLIEVAETVKAVSEKIDGRHVNIDLEESDITLWAGMDSSEFMDDMNWRPQEHLFSMVKNIYLEY